MLQALDMISDREGSTRGMSAVQFQERWEDTLGILEQLEPEAPEEGSPDPLRWMAPRSQTTPGPKLVTVVDSFHRIDFSYAHISMGMAWVWK